MLDKQLWAAVADPTLAVVLGFIQNNVNIAALEKRMDGFDRQLEAVRAELSVMRHDLQQFFRDLGRHEEASIR